MKSSVKPTVGYSDISTVKLDFDGYSFRSAKYLANRICNHFKLEGFVILKSSKNNYHVIFDCSVSWAVNVHIMCWVAIMVEGKKLKDDFPVTKYALMQCIKGSSCLRIGKKQNKPSPRVVFKFGEHDNEIKKFLKKKCLIFRLKEQ